jgi:aminoglycoside phosphotransferase (APT) family kinase protein
VLVIAAAWATGRLPAARPRETVPRVGRCRTGSPPTPTGPDLCPPGRVVAVRCWTGLIRAAGSRSARGYPAAVSSPVGADPAVVGPYLAATFADERWRSVAVDLVAAGMSNLTYVVTPVGPGGRDDEAAVILRRPPTGAVLATAHDMVREHTVVSALGPTAVPVPRTLHLCTDTEVLGAPFYVMERVHGVHVVSDLPTGYADDPADRRRIGDGLVDVLADLHAVDPAAVGLSGFGRPEGFLARQVRRWTTQWEHTRDRDRPELDALAARLAETVPETARSGIVHGDYRLDNCLLDPDRPGGIRAVLDWEMSTLGDPLTDLGMMFVYWPQAGEERASMLSPVTTLPGFPTRLEVAERYAQRSGTDLSRLQWYVGFAFFKFAAIVAGIVARSAAGAMAGKDTTGYAERIGPCVELGRAALEDGAI